jgi:hypothetical protein
MVNLANLRPPHGWRVVVWDLAIVTLGVLIALVVQQWADESNADRRTREALAGIQDELASHYGTSVEWRVVEPCIVAQIDSLTARVLHSGSQLDPAPVESERDNFHFVLRMPSKPYPRSSWDTATSEGLVARLDRKLRIQLNSHYSQVEMLNEMSRLHDDDFLGLTSLGLPVPMDASTRYAMIHELQEIRGRVEWRDTLSGQTIDHIQKVQMVPAPVAAQNYTERFGTFRYCKAHHLPMRTFAQAMMPVPN